LGWGSGGRLNRTWSLGLTQAVGYHSLSSLRQRATTTNKSVTMNPRVAIPENPLTRFKSIYAALEKDRRWWRGSLRLRYGAMAAICTDGESGRIATGIRDMERQLKDASPWNLNVGPSIRFILGAVLYQNGDSAKAFIREVERVRKMFRAEKLHRALYMEMLAILVLRIQSGGGLVTKQTVSRFRNIYDEMKQNHRWLTGADDFPACAILTGQDGTSHSIGEKTESIYSELRSQKFAGGNPLQTASNLLFLADGSPRVLAERMSTLKTELRAHKVRINQMQYDELAILAFLDQPATRVVAEVLGNRDELKKIRPRFDAGTIFNVAVGIAFVKLSSRGAGKVAISQTKTLLDMQAVIAAQQAAVAGAAAASAAAS